MGIALDQFQLDLNAFVIDEVPKEFKRRHIEIIIYLYNQILEGMPVRTGHAKGNWRVSMHTPGNGVLGIDGEGVLSRPTESIRGDMDTMKVGDIIWIYNNVHYMTYIEDGSPNNPPRLVVASAIENTRMYIASRGW